MNRPLKAALLSAFVFPGVGQLYLKQYLAGIVLLASSAMLSFFIVSTAVNTALDVVAKIQTGGVSADSDAITQLVEQQSQGTEQAVNLATYGLTALWLIGIVDAYRRGRARDKADASRAGSNA